MNATGEGCGDAPARYNGDVGAAGGLAGGAMGAGGRQIDAPPGGCGKSPQMVSYLGSHHTLTFSPLMYSLVSAPRSPSSSP